MKKEPIAVACLVVFLVLFTFKLFAYNLTLWQYIFERTSYKNFETKEELDKYAANIIGFVNNKEELSDSFSQSEKSHMQDVKQVYFAGRILMYLSVLLFVLATFKKADWNFITKWSAYVLLIFSLLVILLLIISFSLAFDLFHSFLFAKGTWQFGADSLLIRMFPQEFFFIITSVIFTTIIIEGLLLLLYSWQNAKFYKAEKSLKKKRG